jgi:hypothetical protein
VFAARLARPALAAVLAVACAHADATIFKWRDAQGTMHYGEHPPAGAKATPVDVDDARPESERAAAQRVADERAARAAAIAPAAGPSAPPAVAATADTGPAPVVLPEDADCRRQRELFLESQRFRAVRRADGSTAFVPVGRPVLAPACDAPER